MLICFVVSLVLMTVVGFNWPVEHDHAVGVIVDGELVFASEEERWTRHKTLTRRTTSKRPKTSLPIFEGEVRNKAKGRGRIRSKL
jgi:predicted NodU family carbamoyl transferase